MTTIVHRHSQRPHSITSGINESRRTGAGATGGFGSHAVSAVEAVTVAKKIKLNRRVRSPSPLSSAPPSPTYSTGSGNASGSSQSTMVPAYGGNGVRPVGRGRKPTVPSSPRTSPTPSPSPRARGMGTRRPVPELGKIASLSTIGSVGSMGDDDFGLGNGVTTDDDETYYDETDSYGSAAGNDRRRGGVARSRGRGGGRGGSGRLEGSGRRNSPPQSMCSPAAAPWPATSSTSAPASSHAMTGLAHHEGRNSEQDWIDPFEGGSLAGTEASSLCRTGPPSSLIPNEERLVHCFCVIGPNGELAKSKRSRRKKKPERGRPNTFGGGPRGGIPRRPGLGGAGLGGARRHDTSQGGGVKADDGNLEFQDLSKLKEASEINLAIEIIDEFPLPPPRPSSDGEGEDNDGTRTEDESWPSLVPKHVPKFVFPDGCRPALEQRDPTFFSFAMPLQLKPSSGSLTSVPSSHASAATDNSEMNDRSVDCKYDDLKQDRMIYGACLTVYDYKMDMGSMLAIVKKSRYKGNLPLWMTRLNTEPIFLPRSLVLLSYHPFYDAWRIFLKSLYKISLVGAPLPLERYIANFVREVPLPPRGCIAVEVCYTDDDGGTEGRDEDDGTAGRRIDSAVAVGGDRIRIMKPPRNKLPLVDFSYRPLFATLSVGNVMVVFGCLLQETRVVVCSKHYSILTPVVEGLLSLLFPLVWQGLCIPVLPAGMIKLLDTNVPYLVGLHRKYLTDVKGKKRPPGVVFVDLDEDTVHLGVDAPGKGKKGASGRERTKTACRRTPFLPEREAGKLRAKLWKHASSAFLWGGDNFQRGRITMGTRGGIVDNDYRDAYAKAPETTASSGASGAYNPDEDSTAMMEGMDGASRDGISAADDGNDASRKYRREEVLAEADLAFLNKEHITLRGFVGSDKDDHSVDLRRNSVSSANSLRSQSTSSYKWIARGVKQASQVTSPRRSLLEKEGGKRDRFSERDIRSAFLRFFISIFRNYDQYIAVDDGVSSVGGNSICSNWSKFLQDEFIEKEYSRAGNEVKTDGFLRTLFSTAMFLQFIDDRVSDPMMAEVRLFDESILAKKNTETRVNQEKKATPFLSDKSDVVSEIYIPSPPCHRGLPQDGRTYHHDVFPKLQEEFWGKVREPKRWEQERSGRPRPGFHLRPSAAYRESQRLQNRPSSMTATPSPTDPNLRMPDPEPSQINRLDSDDEDSLEEGKGWQLLQASVRAFLARRKYRWIQLCTVEIQSVCRMYFCEVYLRRARGAASLLQKVFRGQRIRAMFLRYMRYSRAASMIQAAYRDGKAKGIRKRLQSATLLQSVVRCYAVRRRYLMHLESAVKIEAIFRGRRTRFVWELILDVVSEAQACVRGFLTRRALATLRKNLIAQYREQLVELWRRSFTPLIYRSKFWTSVQGFGFLVMGLYADELTRLWGDLGVYSPDFHNFQGDTSSFFLIDGLGVPANPVTRVFSVVNIQLRDARSKSDGGPERPIFPAETMAAKLESAGARHHPLLDANRALAAERMDLYEKLGSKAFRELKDEIYNRFFFSKQEKQRKKKIIESLWESLDFAPYSARVVLILQREPSESASTQSREIRKVRQMFEKGTLTSNRNLGADTSDWLQGKTRDRISHNLEEVATSCIRPLPPSAFKRRYVKTVHSPNFIKQRNAITKGMSKSSNFSRQRKPGTAGTTEGATDNEWSKQRFILIRRFLSYGRWYAKPTRMMQIDVEKI